jgi:hypothetical protein
MNKKVAIFILALTALSFWRVTAIRAEGDADDLSIIPGVRVGAIEADSTEDQLKKTYGAANVMESDISDGEGRTRPGVTIFPNDPRKKISVIWKDSQLKQGVDDIWLRSACSPICQSDWEVTNGLTLGMTLQDLQRLNGNPFTLTNYKGSNGGWVQSWNNGQLDLTLNASGTIIVRLAGPGQGQLTPADQMNIAQLDAVTSDMQALQDLNPTVNEIRLEFKSGGIPPQ